MQCVKVLLIVTVGVLGTVVRAGSADPVSFSSLLAEMVNRELLARSPDPYYTCRQASSYERTSVSANQSGWYANRDWSHFIRAEHNQGRTEWVMLDAEGPGAIVRIWAGGVVKEGVIRFYLDGSKRPTIEGNVYEIISGGRLIAEPFSGVRSRGHNLYLPIPYAKSCKITFDGPNYWQTGVRVQRFWYNVNYRTYEPGTSVETFQLEDLKTAGKQLEDVGASLLNPKIWPTTGGWPNKALEGQIAPNDMRERIVAGPGAIEDISVKVEAEDVAQALRSLVLVLIFDGKQTVWCPVGDFFGSGFGLNPFHGWWRTVERDGTLRCRWVMPFAENCTIRLQNYGRQTVTVREGRISQERWNWDDRSLYFHSAWRHQKGIEVQGRQGQDFNFVAIRGKGTYVGDTLSLHNGAAGWWGEGDEKIFVDAEVFPSHFGTGTEDYYGYSYGNAASFEAPFHAQPRGKGNNAVAYTTNTRTRGLDAIPFDKSLRLDMELWHWASTKLTCAVATHWYATQDSTCNVFSDVAAAAAKIDPEVSQ
ncbi:MAG: DUF2961 domain-containing protein [Planctomycetota bacterium]|jgi:hypothetical protein